MTDFLALDASRRRMALLLLCRHALAEWSAYVAATGPIVYHDSVIGMRHEVETGLPAEVLEAVERGVDTTNLSYRYQEPIVAMQDDDLVFGGSIDLAYYAIYNLYRKYLEGHSIDDEIIIRQALASVEDPERWESLLADAVTQARRSE